MARAGKIARRMFLIGSAAVAGGVVFGYWKYRQPYDNPLLPGLEEGAASLTPYVRVDQQGITVITPRAEMGQGIHTTLAALVAEELDIGIDAVNVEHGPASPAYFNAALMEEGVPFMPTDHGRVSLRGVRVPDSAIFGGEGRGLQVVQHFFNENRIRQAASSLGAAQYCIDQSVEYAKVRAPFGVPLARN